MEIKLILGPAGSGKTTKCLELVSEELKNHEDSIFFLTSTQAKAEIVTDTLLSKHGALFGFRAGTFFQLAQNLTPGLNYLSPIRKTMIINEALSALINQTLTLKKVADLPGLAPALANTISELKQSMIAPDRILSKKDIPQKIKDIAEVYKTYGELCRRYGFVDEEDVLILALSKLENGRMQYAPTVVFVDEFYEYTTLQMRLLEQLSRKCRKMVITLLYDESRPNLFQIPNKTLRQLQKILTIKDKIILKESHRFKTNKGLHPLALVEKHLFGEKANYPDGNIKINKAPDTYGEIEAIARKIHHLLEKNVPPESIAVLFRHTEQFASYVNETFSEFGIPFEMMSRESLISSPLISSFLKILDIISDDFMLEDLVSFLKLSFSSLSSTEAADFEAFLLKQGFIKGHETLKELLDKAGTDYNLSLQNRDKNVPLTIININYLLFLAEEFKGGSTLQGAISENKATAKEYALRVAKLFQWFLKRNLIKGNHTGLPLLETSASLSAKAMTSYLNELIKIIDVIPCDKKSFSQSSLLTTHRSPPTAPPSFNQFLSMFRYGLTGIKLPRSKNRVPGVLVSDIHSCRGLDFKYVFIGNMLESAFPYQAPDDTILNDEDRYLLKKMGLPILLRRERNIEESLLFYIAMTRASDDVFLSYSYTDAKGNETYPSAYLKELKEVVDLKYQEMPISEPIPSWEDRILSRDGLERLSLELFKPKDSGVSSNTSRDYFKFLPGEVDSLLKECPSIINIVDTYHRFREWVPEAKISDPKVLDRIAKIERPFSSSQLQKFADCPFKYFADYILGIREMENIYSPADRGNIIHGMLREIYHKFLDLRYEFKGELNERTTEKLKEEIWGALERKLRSSPMRRIFEYEIELEKQYIVENLLEFLRHEWQSLEGYALIPGKFEIGFGMEVKGDMDPASKTEPFVLKDGDDEIKLRGIIDRIDIDSEGKFASVIDYKSGKSKFKKMDALEGKDLQIAIYMLALKHHFGLEAVSGEYYSLRERKRTGISSKAMLERFSLPKSLTGIESDELDQALKRAKDFIFDLVRNIHKGEISVKPRDNSVCRYCSYPQVCRYEFYKALEI